MRDDIGDLTLDELAHYGVKGMKWGVRRDSSDGNFSSKASKSKTYAGKTTDAFVMSGASMAGGLIGSTIGTTVLGPGIGSSVGAFVGSKVVAGKVGKKISADRDKSREAQASAPGKHIKNKSSKYGDGDASADIRSYGVDGASRINAAVSKGSSLQQARKSENSFQRNSDLVLTGAQLSYSVLSNPMAKQVLGRGKQAGYKKAFDAGAKRNAARSANNAFANSRGLPAPLRMAPKNRRGVQNVRSF